MKLTLKTKNVKEILKKAKKIYPKNNIKPILKSIIIGGDGTFTVSTLNESIATFFPEIIEISDHRGVYSIELDVLKKAVDKIKSDDFTLDFDKKCLLTFKNIEIELPLTNVDDYPELLQPEGKPQILEMPTDHLKKMLEKTIFCASTDEMIPNLNGVLFEINNDKLSIVTADSYRMAVYNSKIHSDIDTNELSNPITLTNPLGESGNVFLPLRSITEVYNSLKYSKDDTVKIKFYKRFTTIMIAEKTDVFYQIWNQNRSFPNYKAVLPENFETEIIIDKKQATETVEIAKTLFNTKGDTIIFEMNGKIEIKGKQQDAGKFTAVLDGTKRGSDNRIAFDPFYILDGFKKIDGDNVRMQFVDNNNALQMTEVDDDQFIHIIMPVKIRS